MKKVIFILPFLFSCCFASDFIDFRQERKYEMQFEKMRDDCRNRSDVMYFALSQRDAGESPQSAYKNVEKYALPDKEKKAIINRIFFNENFAEMNILHAQQIFESCMSGVQELQEKTYRREFLKQQRQGQDYKSLK